jgi:hypothetical protein
MAEAAADQAAPRRRPGRPRKTPVEGEAAASADAGDAPRRGRPRRKKEEAQEGDEMMTDESGFVTHIKGKRIF